MGASTLKRGLPGIPFPDTSVPQAPRTDRSLRVREPPVLLLVELPQPGPGVKLAVKLFPTGPLQCPVPVTLTTDFVSVFR